MESIWKKVVAVVVVLTLVAVVYEGNHASDDLDRVTDGAIQLLSLPLGVIAIAAAARALRGDAGAPTAVAVAAVSALGVGLINGAGSWATPLAIALCAVAAVLRPRAAGSGDVDRADDATS